MRVEPVRWTGIYYEADIDMHQFVFLCDVQDEGTPRPADSEIEACGFFAVDDLPRPIHSFVVRRVGDALAGKDLGLLESLPPRIWIE